MIVFLCVRFPCVFDWCVCCMFVFYMLRFTGWLFPGLCFEHLVHLRCGCVNVCCCCCSWLFFCVIVWLFVQCLNVLFVVYCLMCGVVVMYVVVFWVFILLVVIACLYCYLMFAFLLFDVWCVVVNARCVISCLFWI